MSWSGSVTSQLKLAEPVRGVAPAALYDRDDEAGQVVTFVGRGDFGTGLTGPETNDRIKRGATNTVDEVDADPLVEENLSADSPLDATQYISREEIERALHGPRSRPGVVSADDLRAAADAGGAGAGDE